MKKVLLCAFLAIGLAACSMDGGKGDGGEGGDGGNSMKDITDRKGCKGPAENGATLLTSWNSTFRQTSKDGEIYFFNNATFSTNSLQLKVTCSFPNGKMLSTGVIVPITIDGSHIEVLDGRQNEAVDGDLRCFVNMKRGGLDYSLVGTCLALQRDGRTEFLVK